MSSATQTKLIRELEKLGGQPVYEPVDRWQEVVPGDKDSNLLVSFTQWDRVSISLYLSCVAQPLAPHYHLAMSPPIVSVNAQSQILPPYMLHHPNRMSSSIVCFSLPFVSGVFSVTVPATELLIQTPSPPLQLPQLPPSPPPPIPPSTPQPYLFPCVQQGRMYQDPARWAYLFQSYVLLTMMEAHDAEQVGATWRDHLPSSPVQSKFASNIMSDR